MVKKDKIQSRLAQAAIQAAQEGYPVFSVSSDVQGSTGIASFQKSFPIVLSKWGLLSPTWSLLEPVMPK